MFSADQIYGSLPTATPQLATDPAMRARPRQPASRGPARRAAGEGAGSPPGDPVLIWVLLIGLAAALGWVSVAVSARIG